MKYIDPVRIISYENCLESENILKGNPAQPGFSAKDSVKLNKGGYILLDFGKEVNGCLVVTTLGISQTPAHYRIVYGESVMEALSSIGKKNATNDHSIRDMVYPISRSSTIMFAETGFRFAKIEAVDADFVIKSVKAKTEIRTLEYRGNFISSDARLNEIWKTGAYTVLLNMQDYLWDGIKRDRNVWIGDMHPEVATIRTVFGDDNIVKKSLDYVKNDTEDGNWMNNILTYSMWWIIIQYDWFMHYGDFGYLKLQTDCIKGIVDKSFDWIDSDYSFDGIQMFLDWSSRGLEDEPDGIRAVFVLGLARAAKLLEFLDETEYAKKCLVYAQRVRDVEVKVRPNRRVASLLALADKEKFVPEEILADNSAEEMSCFMGYYVLLAKAKRGEMQGALDIIRTYWGAMLDLGATTFWEDFDIQWTENAAPIDTIVPENKRDIHGDFGKHCYKGFRHSLCHGWASGPTGFLSEQLAGIEILEPGCKKLRINPTLADLAWYNVAYPTPYGNVEIKCRNKNGKIETDITAPPQVEIVR